MSEVMSDEILAGLVEDAVDAYEDGTVGTAKCVEAYCTEHGISPETAEKAIAYSFREGARAAGIPLSVIEGRSKLSDHFSPEYIKSKVGR